MMTPEQEKTVKLELLCLAAKLHEQFGVGEGEMIYLFSETVYDYFDQVWEIREITEYSPEQE